MKFALALSVFSAGVFGWNPYTDTFYPGFSRLDDALKQLSVLPPINGGGFGEDSGNELAQRSEITEHETVIKTRDELIRNLSLPAGWNYTYEPPLITRVEPWKNTTDNVTEPYYKFSSMKNIPDVRLLLDQHGRRRIFHGVNVVFKGKPYIPFTNRWDPWYSFTEEDYDLLANLNVNVVRLGVLWSGAEPERDQWDQSYFDRINVIVEGLKKRGIYVMLDMHQDLYSEVFCGNGFPNWATVPQDPISGTESRAFPYPYNLIPTKKFKLNYTTDNVNINTNMTNTGIGRVDLRDCGRLDPYWPAMYIAQSVQNSFQNMFVNRSGLTMYFGRFWKRVATEVGMKHSNILGYELMNEPWAGAVHLRGSLFWPRNADSQNLQPFYDALATDIRTVHPEAIIHFGGVTWGNWVLGFTAPPGGFEHADHSVISYHFYPGFGPNMLQSIKSNVQSRLNDAQRLRCGLFLTEFRLTKKNLVHLDETFQSWAAWQYKEFQPITGGAVSGSVWHYGGYYREENAKLYARPYAQAIAGHPVYMNFDDGTKDVYEVSDPFVEELLPVTSRNVTSKFYFVYQVTEEHVKANQTAPTEILLDRRYYFQEDPNVFVPDHVASKVEWKFATWKPNNTVLEIWHTEKASPGDYISILVTN